MTVSHDHSKGLLIAALGGMALTVDIPLIRLADGAPWTILMLRSGTTLLAGLIVWSVWRWSTPSAPKLIPGRAGLVVAMLYGLGSIAFITAVFNTTTANLVFILAFNTMFAALLSWLFLGERPRPATFVTMAVMIIGVGIIVGGSIGSGHLFGDLLAATSAFCVASAITISRHSGKDMGFPALIGVVLPFLVAAYMVWTTGFHVNAPWWIILNGGLVIPFSFFCLATAPKHISAPEVAMFYLLETVLAPVWVWMVFNEVPSRDTLIGGAILIIALIAHSLWQLHLGRQRHAALAVRHPA
ncbi:DMT family transporter [Mesorhizobium retamae]|uniref:DMT family transporter n=1 Tax=Mesorhizobium retamae TaxID=2912854 RepID=A0ABS9QE89_9HYPH|nr:DMT family transporter [Mesorhizobium sp. IRAMC:0171]